MIIQRFITLIWLFLVTYFGNPGSKKATVEKHATNWSKSSKGAKIADWVKGTTFEYRQDRAISQSYSNREYLLYNKGVAIGWILSQDIVGGYGSDKVGKPTPVPVAKPVIKVGSNVVVTNPVDYNGVRLGVSGTYKVMELKGSRAVIGRGGVVTAAINVGNLKLL